MDSLRDKDTELQLQMRNAADTLYKEANSLQVSGEFDLSNQKAFEAVEAFRKLRDQNGEDKVIYLLGMNSFLQGGKLKKLNEEVEEKNRSIMESLDYAKHIQESILPHTSMLRQYFSDSFVFSRAKDIISGDFFWIYEKENEILVAAVDCTGHGVSGSLMSVVANSLLNQVTSNQWMPNPSFILNEVNHYMQRTLAAHDDSGLRDSMDIALLSVARTKADLLFAGAHNSLYVISGGVLTEYRGDDISMGNGASAKFSGHKIKLKKGDCLYVFTDGYADQKGGPNQRKFYYDPFKALLLSIHTLPMEKQKIQLHRAMDEWMGETKQIDDMLIIGIRI